MYIPRLLSVDELSAFKFLYKDYHLCTYHFLFNVRSGTDRGVLYAPFPRHCPLHPISTATL